MRNFSEHQLVLGAPPIALSATIVVVVMQIMVVAIVVVVMQIMAAVCDGYHNRNVEAASSDVVIVLRFQGSVSTEIVNVMVIVINVMCIVAVFEFDELRRSMQLQHYGRMRSCNKDDSSSHYQLCLCGSFNSTIDDGIEKQHKYASASVAVETDEPPGLESLHSQDFIHFKTRNLVYKQLLEAMEHNYMTGIHGIRGIGKTTLAKQVCLKLHKSIKFDLVIFITVSKKSSSDMKEIQDMIAEKVGLSLKGKNEWERTETITKRLMNGETILLILDDVREHLNSQELGIPSRPDNNMKCKVLVTSREERYCKLLGCHRSIQVDKLSMRDAWMSFEKHVSINDNSSEEVQDLGKQIAEAWEGLPIIAAIASILKGRPHQVWKKTSSYLRRKYYLKGYGFDEGWFKAYAFLNFSYEDLDIEKAQMLSILLSMFPLNREVSVEMLTRLGIGVGLFCEVEKYSEVRSEILRLKDILIHSHVWFEDEGGNIKMNDPIWHMIRAGELSLCKIESNRNKWVLSTIEKNIHYVYYDDLRVEEMELDLIPSWYGYDGTKVEMLVVNVEATNSVEVPDAFFEKMTRLQVLSLSSNDLHPMLALKLPSSLRSLTNICSLLLSHWKFSDISIIGELQSLDTLDFDDCSISEFPKEISALKLRLLSLKRCQIEMNNPFKVIERCLTLQELYYNDNEVSTLDSVNEAEEIYQSETFPTLNRYHLQQGEADASRAKCVRLRNIDALVSEATFKYLIKGAEILHLKEIQGGWRNLIPEIVPSMNDVVELCLESCSNVECLVNTQSHVVSAFSKLVELKLSCMDNLKQLCSGEDHPSDFLKSLNRLSIEHCVHLQGILFKSKVNLCNLKSINLFHCQDLTSLFMLSTAKSLVLLEELRIGECKLLIDIVKDENDHKSNGLIFPKLETLEIEGCERLECILPVAFPRDVMLLQKIKISKCPKLKHIFYEEGGDIRVSRLQKVELVEVSHLFNISLECYPLLASKVKRPSPRVDFKAKQQDPSKDHHHKLRGASRIKIPTEDGLTQGPKSSILSSEYPPKQSQGLNILVVCNIKQLVLKDLDKIKYLFTLSTASSMMLEILIIDSCHVLKHIIDIEDGSDGKNLKVVFEKLKELSVTGCSQLECMFGEYNAAKDDQNYSEIHIHLPALKKLILQKLPKFSLSSITWTSLKEFVLVRCPYFIVNPISDMMIHFDSRKLVTTTIKDIREIDKHFLTLETLNIEGYQAESIFCVSGVKIIGQVRLGLQFLKLSNLPRMLSICVGSINSFVFQNLKKIQIIRCLRIKVIFQASVSSYLPELESLEIQDCEELEQIVDSPQPYFPKLEVLEVKQCRNLKHLIHASHVPNVRTITIVECFKLEVIFPDSSLSPLSELEVLEIQYCLNLKKIIEEDKKLGNVDSPQPCFPKLAKLMVKECYNLKRLIHASHLPNVRTIRIVECFKLEVIFPDSFSFLSELEVLEIQVCLRLEKIIEEVKNSPRPCFPKLSLLVVNKCQSVKRLIPATYDVPNLKLLIIIEASELEELMGGGAQRRGDDDVSIRNIIVELPKLKLVIFGKLPEATFKEGIELQTVSDRFVYQCPKLSLKATTTFKEINKKVLELLNTDLKNFLYQQQYDDMAKVDIIVQSDVTQTVLRSDLPYSQINEESEKEFVGEVLDSKMIATKTTPTSLPEVQSIERPSSSLLDIPTNKHVSIV
ncbi:PREDICTED: uncharacterized protein LOC109363647 [Lupinus angustifolius]|uniref:uncharacterized protein LOC109363647 n=1 Tax=Lupinus angustifolius TaxID=3871 RepID=UPI00092FA69B|nr:PREDICTED: uncharacterized protein LOC109363647 [Lupinus angustifolius]